jgi:hypothetical protein
MATRKERVRQINIENNKDRLIEKWAEKAVENADNDYVTKLLKQQEEGGLQNIAKLNSSSEGRTGRKDRVRQINIAALQSELYSKDKKTDSLVPVSPGYKPSFNKFVKIYMVLFFFVVIFGFAVYITEGV